MSKPLVGVLLGAILGLIDGLSAYAYPEVGFMMAQIIVGSTIKGLVTGLVAGLVARKLHSLGLGILVGLIVGFALSSLVGAFPDDHNQYHYWPIVIPGSIVGVIVGFATQRFGRTPQTA